MTESSEVTLLTKDDAWKTIIGDVKDELNFVDEKYKYYDLDDKQIIKILKVATESRAQGF